MMGQRVLVASLLLLLGSDISLQHVSAFSPPLHSRLQLRHVATASNRPDAISLLATPKALAFTKSPLFRSDATPFQIPTVFKEAWSALPAFLASIPSLMRTNTNYWQLNLLKHAISLWGLSVVVSTWREIFRPGSTIKFKDRPLYFSAGGLVTCGLAWAGLKTIIPFWTVNLIKQAFSSLWAVPLVVVVVSTIRVKRRRQEDILDVENVVLVADEILDGEDILDLKTDDRDDAEDAKDTSEVQTNQPLASATPEWRDEWTKFHAEFQDEITDFQLNQVPATIEKQRNVASINQKK
jgi:hypothetical protein